MDYTNLKILRKSNKLSQADVAKHLDIARTTYVAIEKNERSLSVDELQKLAKLYNISPQNLIDGDIDNKIEIKVKNHTHKQLNKQKNNNIRIVLDQTNIEKFKEVFLYILEKVGSKANVGETVLYKLLYFIDFDYYEKFEEQLTGATYIKNHYGPTPVDFKVVVDQMIASDEIEKINSKFFNHLQRKYLPHRKPDLSVLNAQELEHIDNVLAKLSDKTATELSDYSHGDVPWKIHKPGEKIDYESVFYRDEQYSVKSYDDAI